MTRFIFRLVSIAAVSTILLLIASQQAEAQAVCVAAKNAQLRKGPGVSFPVTWAVGQYMPFMKVGEKNGWAQVKDLDNQTHWVIARVLTQKWGCAVVRTKQARLRRGPSLRSPASEPELVDRYTPFKKVDREGSWIRVQDDHRSEYWVSETQLWIPMTKTVITF
jgi:uncharacterized protein YgiM (DUF1202 family)